MRDPFSFKDCCHQHFSYLVDEFGYVEKEDDASENQYMACYRRGDITLQIEGLHYGTYASVTITRVSGGGKKEIGIETLIDVRAPESSLVTYLGYPIQAKQEYFITRYAELVHEYARDILAGDFSVYPQIQQAKAQYWAIYNQHEKLTAYLDNATRQNLPMLQLQLDFGKPTHQLTGQARINLVKKLCDQVSPDLLDMHANEIASLPNFYYYKSQQHLHCLIFTDETDRVIGYGISEIIKLPDVRLFLSVEI